MSTHTQPSRTQRAARTRQRLLEAAAEAFAEHGLAASVDEVAARVQLTKGAVYAHFRDKDDLFVSVLEWAIDARLAGLSAALTDGGPPARQARDGAAWFARFLEEDRRWSLLFFEFWLHATRQPELRERYAAYRVRARTAVTALLDERARAAQVALPAPASQLAAAVLALASGLALEGLIDPDAGTSEVLAAALTLLLSPADAGAPA